MSDERTNEDRAYEALIAYVLRTDTVMDNREIQQFMEEYDAGLHQLSEEDKALIEQVKTDHPLSKEGKSLLMWVKDNRPF